MGTDCAEVFSGEIDSENIFSEANRVIPCNAAGCSFEPDDGYPVKEWTKLLRKGQDDVFCQWCIYPWEPDRDHYFLIVARPIV